MSINVSGSGKSQRFVSGKDINRENDKIAESKNTKHLQNIAIIITLAFSVCAVVIGIITTSRYGIGISEDSVTYISTAKNLYHEYGFTTYDNKQYIQWPPLYPMILAGMMFLDMDALTAARVLGILSYGLIIFLSGLIFRKMVKSLVLFSAFLFAITFSTPLINITSHAISEPFFIVMILAFLAVLQNFLENPTRKQLGRFIALIVLSNLAFLQRYIGATLTISCFLTLIFTIDSNRFKRISLSLIYLIFSSVMPIFWFIRNYAISGSFAGLTLSNYSSFGEVFASLLVVMAKWLMPGSENTGVSISIILFICFLLTITIIRAIQEKLFKISFSQRLLYPIAFFSITYIIAIMIVATFYGYETLNERLLSPLYILFIMVVILGMNISRRVFTNLIGEKYLLKDLIGFVLLCVWLFYLAQSSWLVMFEKYTDGAGGYNTKKWRTSSLIYQISNKSINKEIYSNYPDAIYILSNKKALWLPRKADYYSEFMRKYQDGQSLEVYLFNDKRKDVRNIYNYISEDDISDKYVYSDGLHLIINSDN